MKWSERTHWLSSGLRSILTHMFKSPWWILMGNNHARPVLQSGTTDTSDLLQGQRGLFLAGEIITHEMALWQMFGINQPRRTSAGEHGGIVPRPTFSIQRLLTGQLWGLESAPRSDSQQPLPPPPPLKMGAGKIRAQQLVWTTKVHLKRHLLLLFSAAAHSFSLKDTQERKADWEVMNYLTMMSNCLMADILFLEGKGLGVKESL